MKSYSVDLRRKIVAAVERGMSKTQAARLFDVSLSSVKRYPRMARQGNSLAPKRRAGRAPKVDETARKLLNQDMKERPAATIAERISFLEGITGERLRGCADRDTIRLLERRAQDTRSFGEFSKLPQEGVCLCPRSHHTSSSLSGNSSLPCCPKGKWIILWDATAHAYPTEWSSRSSSRSWCSVAPTIGSPTRGVLQPRFASDATSGSNWA